MSGLHHVKKQLSLTAIFPTWTSAAVVLYALGLIESDPCQLSPEAQSSG